MNDVLLQLDGMDHLALAVVGLLFSVLVWRFSSVKYPGFFANQARLFLLAFLTAGIVLPGNEGYLLFSIVIVFNIIKPMGFDYLYVYCIFLIIVYWVIYSSIFYWFRCCRDNA